MPLVRALHHPVGQADDLSLVAGMRSGHRHALIAAGLPTVEALAAAAVTELPRTIGRPSRERLAQQARLQVSERTTGQAAYELLPPEPDRGLLRLPPPSDGDVYLDFEGDPFAADGQGREYLAGLWDRSGRFSTWWAHDHDQEAATDPRPARRADPPRWPPTRAHTSTTTRPTSRPPSSG